MTDDRRETLYPNKQGGKTNNHHKVIYGKIK